LSGYPKALGMSGAVMLVMALLPGIPMIPFLTLGTGAAALAFIFDKRAKLVISTEAKATAAAAKTEARRRRKALED
jgi:flagellar biosynthesis protein FlhA